MNTRQSRSSALRSPRMLQLINQMQRRFFDYEFQGLQNLDESKPSLLVGNHSIFAYDVAIMMVELKLQKAINMRPLADRLHGNIPGWRDMLDNYGIVIGTPDNCDRLMKNKEHILVFPGGAREAMKRRGEEHHLIWKKRTGFARMAVANKYPITPFFVYGADLGYDILWDYGNMQKAPVISPLFSKKSRLNKLLRDGELFPPIAVGRYNTAMPKKTRMIFRFGRPISTRKYKGDTDKDTLWEVRTRVEEAVKQLMRRTTDDLEQKKRKKARDQE